MMHKMAALFTGLFFTTICWAQPVKEKPDRLPNTYIPYNPKPVQSDPIRASLYSMAVPGLGQAYNGHYWKIPIIYAGGAVFGYFIRYNDIFYQKYLNALADQRKTGSNEFDLDERNLDQRVNRFRRSRDYMVILLSVFYAANIIDAYVYAHLSQFDIGDDLSMRITPKIFQTNQKHPYLGVGVNLTF